MLWAINQLCAPIKYLRIRAGPSLFQSKVVYDFILPAALTVLTLVVLALLSVPVSVASLGKLLTEISTLLALLIGFYMAALAAVATFERRGIDGPLRGDDAILKTKRSSDGKIIHKKLTYRQFISYLFGYLSFVSIVLYALLIAVTKSWATLSVAATDSNHSRQFIAYVIEPVVFSIFVFFIWQLLIVSLLGIYFLSERIQSLNDPEG